MANGTVKWFDPAKRYGFITLEGGEKDVFVHLNEVTRAGMDKLVEGQRLSYEIEETHKGPQAKNLRSSGASQNRHKIVGHLSRGEGLCFDTGHQIRRGNRTFTPEVDSLKVTDRFLAARRGSVFEERGREMVLVEYDPKISHGLKGTPAIDENPYNFVPWKGSNPNAAEEPCNAAHDRLDRNRLSGSIGVTLTARTPIFVPAGELGAADSYCDPPRDFFHCWDGRRQRYAIPGSSVKGVVRSLFEALTNSRAGVTDEAELKWKPLYRRRSFRLFRIESMPTKNSSGVVREYMYGLYDRDGELKPRTTRLPRTQPNNDVEKSLFSANLFFVGPSSTAVPHGHTHDWTKIRYRPTSTTFTLDHDTIERFHGMKGHPHLKNHGGENGTAASAARCDYGPGPPNLPQDRHAPDYADVEANLFELNVNDLIFGLPDNGRIVCFGRNVNFLWPSDKSTLELMGTFAARPPDSSDLAGSDPAEAVFGFAGTHGKCSHPFQGRVRFSTFWGPERSDQTRPPMTLMPLTSPSGTKAKSRPLYLMPGQGGKKSSEHDAWRALARAQVLLAPERK